MRRLHHPIVIRLALPPAAAVLIEVETSSTSQVRQEAAWSLANSSVVADCTRTSGPLRPATFF